MNENNVGMFEDVQAAKAIETPELEKLRSDYDNAVTCIHMLKDELVQSEQNRRKETAELTNENRSLTKALVYANKQLRSYQCRYAVTQRWRNAVENDLAAQLWINHELETTTSNLKEKLVSAINRAFPGAFGLLGVVKTPAKKNEEPLLLAAERE